MTTLRTRLAVLATSGALLAGGAAVAAGPAAASVPRCGNSSLAVTATFSQGGAGHSWMSVVYRNQTHSECSLYGYPGLDAISHYGHVIAHAKRTLSGYGAGAHLSTVDIAPGGYASASVEWLNFNPTTSGSCTFSAAINTTPANTSHTVRLPVSVSICDLQVHPTTAGTPQYPDYGPAQAYWISGSHASSAREGAYWAKSEAYLRAGHDYPSQVAELKQLISLPDAMQTPTQNAEWRHDVKELDSFFVTPGLYT
jgi:hypothetical protein